MNKYLKIFSGAAMGVMLSTSAFAAADYAVVLKTLSNPFWVDMKKVLKMKPKRWASASIFLPRLQKGIFSHSCSYSKT
jgi:ABC-type sugar transport system substrate-binding protein